MGVSRGLHDGRLQLEVGALLLRRQQRTAFELAGIAEDGHVLHDQLHLRVGLQEGGHGLQHAAAIGAARVVEFDHGDVAEGIAGDRVGGVDQLGRELGEGVAGHLVVPAFVVGLHRGDRVAEDAGVLAEGVPQDADDLLRVAPG